MHVRSFPLFIILNILLFLSSCGLKRQEGIESWPSSAAYVYELAGECALPAGVQLAISAQVEPEQELQLNMLWKNQGADTLYINSQEAMLLNKEGWRAGPVEVEQASIPLHPGSTATLRFRYQPVSNMRLYKLAGVRGALAKEYSLPLSFVKGGSSRALLSDTLHFSIDDSLYQHYLSTTGGAGDFSLYTIQTNKEQEEQIRKRLGALFSESGHSGGARLMEEEVLLAGFNLRVGVYERADTLSLHLRGVNHSPLPLYLVPQKLGIKAKGKNLLSIEGAVRPAVFLKKGERFEIHRQYRKQQPIDSLWFDLGGVKLADKETALVEDDLLLERRE